MEISIVNLIGSIGAFMLAICGLPQAIESFKQKNSDGVSTLFITLWFVGEILLLYYVTKTSGDIILIINYLFNLLIVSVIGYYKIRK
jgi:uncharacterized protein with PQ loop repeat